MRWNDESDGPLVTKGMGDGEAGRNDTREWNLTMVVAQITTEHSLKNSI
jgi:hypothetical protein